MRRRIRRAAGLLGCSGSAKLRAMTEVFAGKHLVLGLSGGVACYKSAQLVRLLVQAGATVQVVMTEAAEQFITPVTMQALSGRPVYGSQWDAREPNNMPTSTSAARPTRC